MPKCAADGATGPVIRGAGVAYDVRRVEPYSSTQNRFPDPGYPECDSMARYLVRMDEMEQSLRIIEQALDTLPSGPSWQGAAVLKLPPGDYCYAVEAARRALHGPNRQRRQGHAVVSSCARHRSPISASTRKQPRDDPAGCTGHDGKLDLVIPTSIDEHINHYLLGPGWP